MIRLSDEDEKGLKLIIHALQSNGMRLGGKGLNYSMKNMEGRGLIRYSIV